MIIMNEESKVIKIKVPGSVYDRLKKLSDFVDVPLEDVVSNFLEKISYEESAIRRFTEKYLVDLEFTGKEKLALALLHLISTGHAFVSYYINRIFDMIGPAKGLVLEDILVDDLRNFSLAFAPLKGGSEWIHSLLINIFEDRFEIAAFHYISHDEVVNPENALKKISDAVLEIEGTDMYYELISGAESSDYGEYNLSVTVEDDVIQILFEISSELLEDLPTLRDIEELFEAIISEAKIEYKR